MIERIKRLRRFGLLLALVEIALFLVSVSAPASAQQTSLQLDPAQTAIHFTLDAALHTVHGTFQARQGELQWHPAAGTLSGEIVVDAESGRTGNGMRDRKMSKDVLESEQYPDISFRPDRVTGALALQGKSSVRVHGVFRIHGVDREIEVPAEVEMSAGNWTAHMHFTIPYERWGMKNPSTLFLRVSDSVEIDLAAAGTVVQRAATSSGSAQ